MPTLAYVALIQYSRATWITYGLRTVTNAAPSIGSVTHSNPKSNKFLFTATAREIEGFLNSPYLSHM